MTFRDTICQILSLPLDVPTFLQSLFSYAIRIRSHDKVLMPRQCRLFLHRTRQPFLPLPMA